MSTKQLKTALVILVGIGVVSIADASMGFTGLGDLSGGDVSSHAASVSGDGSAVAGLSTSTNGFEAFFWDEANGMQSLTAMLEAGGVDLSGWTLTDAQDISGDGTTIVGYGTHNGNTEAFVAVIPEPSVVALVSVSGVGLWFIRRFSSGKQKMHSPFKRNGCFGEDDTSGESW